MLMAPITYTFLANADTKWVKCMCGHMKPYWPELLVLGFMFMCKIITDSSGISKPFWYRAL
jgi:hypothetical protein